MSKSAQPKKQRPAEISRKPSFQSAGGVPMVLPTFPVVGIGASAGGLEALELFLKQVPKNCGLAFVVVQHLDPKHKGILAELLQRDTDMPVAQIKDQMK